MTYTSKPFFFITLFSFLLLLNSAVIADDTTEYHDQVKSVYNFSPHNLDKKGIQKASKKLDKFWKSQKKKKKKIIPLLRKELSTDGHKPFFYYDGASLLLSLSATKEDKNIVLQSIVKSDLQDLQHTDYLRRVHSLATEGFDTTEAAFHMLDYKDFYAYLPMHSLEIKHTLALLFMLQPTSEHFYINKVIERLNVEADERIKTILLECLWMTVTDKGNVAIKEISTNPNQPETIQKFAQTLLERNEKMTNKDSDKSIEELKMKRRKSLTGLSDEVLYDFYDITREILAAYKK